MGYARLLARWPQAVLAVVAALTLACLVATFTLSSPPTFADPKLGFVARGTELSARWLSYQRLLSETRGLLDAPAHDDPFSISAADLGTEREWAVRNRSKQAASQSASTAALRHQHAKGTGGAAQTRGSLDENDLNNIQDEEELESPAERRGGSQNTDTKQLPFFCESPRVEYARYVYEHRNHSDLLTWENLRAMCELDSKVRALSSLEAVCTTSEPDGPCCRSWSAPEYIAALMGREGCEALEANDVAAARVLLAECAQWRPNLAQCRESRVARRPGACAQLPSHCLRSAALITDFLQFITDTHFRPEEPLFQLTYAMTFLPLPTGVGSEEVYKEISCLDLSRGGVSVVGIQLGLKDALFDDYLRADAVWFAAALLAVLLVMWLYTRSLFLTFMASLTTAMSLLIAFCLYTAVYGIQFFPYMNLLAVVLLIGIGADDVFLYCRVWALAKGRKDAGTLARVVSDTLRHAALSMCVTSLTTAAALLASVLSAITALRCFAVFASTSVLVNLLLMLTWLPAALVLHDRCCAHACLCCAAPPPPPAADSRSLCQALCRAPSALSRAARHLFEQLLPRAVVRLRFASLFVLGVLAIAAVFVVLYYPKLKLPTSNEFQIFASTHPFEVYDLRLKRKFSFEKAEAGAMTMPITLVWGAKAVDTGDHFDPYSTTELQLKPDFNLASMDSQRTLLRICRDLHFSPWFQDTLGLQYTNCFIEAFKDFMERDCVDRYSGERLSPCCKTSLFPYIEEVFLQCLSVWADSIRPTHQFFPMNENAGPRFDRTSGSLVALVVEVASRQPYSHNYEEMRYFYKSLDDWLSAQQVRAPAELGTAWFLSDLRFYDLQASLALGTPAAIGTSIGVATLVAFCTTLNVLVTLWAMVSIAASVFVVVALLIALGWELNIMEALTLTVAVGLAMDFTLHYGVAYRLAPGEQRHPRVLTATARLASPVALAALTTLLAGASVLPATVHAYRQLGLFLVIIMLVSWVYATFFFQALLRCIGPIGDFGQFRWPALRCCGAWRGPRRTDKTRYASARSESTFSSGSSTTAAAGAPTSTSELHELEPLAPPALRDTHAPSPATSRALRGGLGCQKKAIDSHSPPTAKADKNELNQNIISESYTLNDSDKTKSPASLAFNESPAASQNLNNSRHHSKHVHNNNHSEVLNVNSGTLRDNATLIIASNRNAAVPVYTARTKCGQEGVSKQSCDTVSLEANGEPIWVRRVSYV